MPRPHTSEFGTFGQAWTLQVMVTRPRFDERTDDAVRKALIDCLNDETLLVAGHGTPPVVEVLSCNRVP